MKNITLAIDEHVLDEVRQIAARNKTTVNGLVRDYLTKLASEKSRIAHARERLAELARTSEGRLGEDWVWRREDAYEDRLFPRHKRPPVPGSGEGG
jgi:hypothetical protein